MKVNRRNAMLMGALTPAGGFAIPGMGGETDTTTQGINIKLFWHTCLGGWTVTVLDWENIGNNWRPGNPVPWKHVPLKEYLEAMEQEFNLVPKT